MRLAAVTLALVLAAAPTNAAAQASDAADRASLIARAKVWTPTDVRTKDLTAGPLDVAHFSPGEMVTCDYLDKKLEGNSRKFACLLSPDDEVKVKFGATNGEVYGEVAATRLLWALGFGADRMYPVRVICRGCPEDVGTPTARQGERLIDPAVIERRMPGGEPPGGDEWSWAELDLIDERAGGATQAERDALRLMAVLLQHTDSKPEQQRLLCIGEPAPATRTADPGTTCLHPFMMLNDVGLTFGAANLLNANDVGSINLRAWAETPVWKTPDTCVGNLPKSLSGTLRDPVIGEEGRRLLAGLLARLSDRQLHDLFDVAQVERREQLTRTGAPESHTTDEWVAAFERKRAEIAGRRCNDSWSSVAPPTFDVGPVLWFQSFASPRLTRAANLVSLLGYTAAYVALGVVLMFGYRLRAGAALLLLVVLTSTVVNATKVVVSYPRPDGVDARVQTLGNVLPDVVTSLAGRDVETANAAADTGGFPSGHVADSAAFFLGLALLFQWRWAWIAGAAWVAAMAASRMYLGRHFLGDVLGGVGVGIIVTGIALSGLTLARLANPTRAMEVARRLVVVAAILAALALMIQIPAQADAGRFLGLALGTFSIVRVPETLHDRGSLPVRALRIVLAAAWFALGWWAMAWWPAAAGGPLVRHAIPMMILLAGPIYSGRLFTAE
jgi:membrane-associated phospholipid phosphatase